MRYSHNKNGIPFVLYIVSIGIQRVYFHFSGKHVYQFAFAYGLFPEEYVEGIPYMELLALCLPIIFLLLYFSGDYIHYIEGYGRFLMIRHFSKERMVLQQTIRMAGKLIIFTVLEILLWRFGNQEYEGFHEPLYLVFLTYYLSLVTMIFLQYFLETLVSVQAANLIVTGYLVLSQFVIEKIEWSSLPFIFFPAFIQAGVVSFSYEIWIYLAILSAGFIALSIRRCRKKDIL